MEYLLHIKPTFNCLIKVLNNEQILNKNRIYTFIVNTINPLPISFYPTDEQNKNSLPFATALNFKKNTLTCDKKQISIIRFPENNYLLIVKPFLFYYPNSFETKSQTLTFGNTNHLISWLENETSSIKISSKQANYKINVFSPIYNVKFKTKGNFLLGYCNQENNKNLVFLIKYENSTYYPYSILNADILEETPNEIITYSKLNDFAGHGQINTFKIENDITQTTTLVYNFDQPFIAKHKEFVPFAFFEAIKVKNYKLARIYMTKTLSEKLTNTHLETFFGSFLYPHQTLSPTYNPEEIALIYKEEKNYYAKVFNLKLNNQNKIEDIVEN